MMTKEPIIKDCSHGSLMFVLSFIYLSKVNMTPEIFNGSLPRKKQDITGKHYR